MLLIRWLVVVLLAGAQAALAAQAGVVEYAHGVASAQQGRQTRIIAKGDAIQEGEIINTGPRGFAIITFSDGGKVTLRPNTTFAVDQYEGTAGRESIVLRLLKGGLRSITGTIGRAKPEAVSVRTATATIGIRGTSFDARLCEADCAREAQARAGSLPRAAVNDPVVARILVLQGEVEVLDAKQTARHAARGTPLYTGETIRTGRNSHAVLLFRDEARVTVTAESEFRLDDVRINSAKPDEGSMALRLVRGAARAFTGLVGKHDPKAFSYTVGTATIGIRGTGFDTRLEQACTAPGDCHDVVYAQLWDGSVVLEGGGQSLLIPLSRAAIYDAVQKRLALLDAVPEAFIREAAPRPDQVPGDDTLFRAIDLGGTPPGFYANVRDGAVVLQGLELGRGEAGYFANGTAVRLTQVPRFLSEDPIPAPESFDERMLRLLEILGDRSDGLICEM